VERRRRGVRALLGRVLVADRSRTVYVFALSYMLGVKLMAAALHRVIVGACRRSDASPCS
jgi:hypothetical protein